MQAIEILPVMLRDGQLLALRPDCAESFVVGWPAGARPDEVALRALARLGLEPIVLHSTSWRHDGAEVVLTYLAVVAPSGAPPTSWAADAVARHDLARGDTTAPPAAIGVAQVLEHALRHLAWLTRDDAVVASALPDWAGALCGDVPQPFRAIGGFSTPG